MKRTRDFSTAYKYVVHLQRIFCVLGVLRSIRTNGCVHFVIYQRVKITLKKSRLPPKKKKIEGEREVAPRPGPEVIKLFSCSAQLRLKFILLINVKMPTIVGILTFMSRINY